MAADSDDITKLEEFLDKLPGHPSNKAEDKMFWTVWARLNPEEAMTHSEMGIKISTIKMLAKPDMDLDKFESTVGMMKKKLMESIKKKKQARLEKEKTEKKIEMRPIKMELVSEPMEVEPLEVEPIFEEEESGKSRKVAIKKLSKKTVRKPVKVKKPKVKVETKPARPGKPIIKPAPVAMKSINAKTTGDTAAKSKASLPATHIKKPTPAAKKPVKAKPVKSVKKELAGKKGTPIAKKTILKPAKKVLKPAKKTMKKPMKKLVKK